MSSSDIDAKKKTLITTNSIMKTQIELIKKKISSISKSIMVKEKELKPEVDQEYEEIRQKINYYTEAISKTKFKIDNLSLISGINNIKSKLKNEATKIQVLHEENLNLAQIYNTQVKSINKENLKYDIKHEEMMNSKISEMKNEYKKVDKERKEVDAEYKQMRIHYFDTKEMINKMKEKIELAKKVETDIDYNNKIEEIENEIDTEQENIRKEEEEYIKEMKRNESLINKLTEEIIKKRDLLKEKGNVNFIIYYF